MISIPLPWNRERSSLALLRMLLDPPILGSCLNERKRTQWWFSGSASCQRQHEILGESSDISVEGYPGCQSTQVWYPDFDTQLPASKYNDPRDLSGPLTFSLLLEASRPAPAGVRTEP